MFVRKCLLRGMWAACLLSAPVCHVAACGAGTDDPDDWWKKSTSLASPFTDKADGLDRADRDCRAILRTARRPVSFWGGYQTDCTDGTCWYVWEVQVDVSRSWLEAGAVAGLLYRAAGDGTWWQTDASIPADGEASLGTRRLAFRFAQHGIPEGAGYPAVLDEAVELIPVVHFSSGERYFDHNRNPGDFDNYRLEALNSWTLLDDPDTCWGEAGRAVRLGGAQVSTVLSGGGTIPDFDTVLWGTVETRPDADAPERVEVHHQVRRGEQVVRDWSPVEAVRVEDGLWEFVAPSYPTTCPHYCYGITYQFAIQTFSGGEIHWDNFAGYGTDYVLSTDFGGMAPVFRGPPAILTKPVRLSYATWQDGVLQGVVLLRNLGYEKNVAVLATTDGWASSIETEAAFHHMPMSREMEYWRFSLSPQEPGQEIRFVVRYRVGGQTHLDDNLGRDYVLDTSGPALRTLPPI